MGGVTRRTRSEFKDVTRALVHALVDGDQTPASFHGVLQKPLRSSTSLSPLELNREDIIIQMYEWIPFGDIVISTVDVLEKAK